jgi:hypothetical protein
VVAKETHFSVAEMFFSVAEMFFSVSEMFFSVSQKTERENLKMLFFLTKVFFQQKSCRNFMSR